MILTEHALARPDPVSFQYKSNSCKAFVRRTKACICVLPKRKQGRDTGGPGGPGGPGGLGTQVAQVKYIYFVIYGCCYTDLSGLPPPKQKVVSLIRINYCRSN